MKKTGTLLLMAFLTFSMVPSCLGEDVLDPDQSSSSESSSSKSVSSVDPENAEDLVSGFTPDYTVTVTYSTGGAALSGDVDMVTSVVDGCDVTITNPGDYGIKYILTGTSQDGFFKLYSTHKQEIELSSLNLRNPDGAAINNQSKKRTYVVLTVSGGALYGLSTRNDGIDANAAMSVTGGVVIGCGSSGAECGIDTIEGSYLTIDGGYVISVGGSVNPTNSKSGKAFVTASLSRGTNIAVYDGETPLFAFQVPSTGGTAALMSAPSMKSGSSYKLYTGVSFTPSYFGCFGTEGISGGKESDKALTASTSVSQGMGGGPGGRW